MSGNWSVADRTRSKKFSRFLKPSARKRNRKVYNSDDDEDSGEDIEMVGEEKVGQEEDVVVLDVATWEKEVEAGREESNDDLALAAENDGVVALQVEDSDDEEIRMIFEEKIGRREKKNAVKNKGRESSSKRSAKSGGKKMSKGKKLEKKTVDEEESERGAGPAWKKKLKKKVEEVEEEEGGEREKGPVGKKKLKKKVEEVEEEEEGEGEEGLVCKFPMNRIQRIMKDQNCSAKIAQEAIFLANKASEKFLELYCKEAYACAFLDRKTQVAYDHLAAVVSKRKKFDFLSDIVPERVKAEDALAQLPEADK